MTDLNRRSALSLALAATAAAAAGESGHRTRHKDARIDPASIDALRIYPPLGIARVGNAADADAYVIGPEVIGGPPTLPDGAPARLVADFRTDERTRSSGRPRASASMRISRTARSSR